jgi:hypothetical protein
MAYTGPDALAPMGQRWLGKLLSTEHHIQSIALMVPIAPDALDQTGVRSSARGINKNSISIRIPIFGMGHLGESRTANALDNQRIGKACPEACGCVNWWP